MIIKCTCRAVSICQWIPSTMIVSSGDSGGMKLAANICRAVVFICCIVFFCFKDFFITRNTEEGRRHFHLLDEVVNVG